MVKPDRERYVYLYVPSVEDKQRYQELADTAGAPLSKFLLGVIEDSLAERENQESRRAMARELEDLRAENKKLREELRLRNLVIERYEGDLKKVREEAFRDISFAGQRKFDAEVIECIKKNGPIQTPRLLEQLDIDPHDIQSIDALSKQLEALESYHLIEITSKGWTWLK